MCTITKELPIIIKCSNPPKDDVESITCMAIESVLKLCPISKMWVYSNRSKINKDQLMPSDKLQSTLSDTLNYFPILSGRITEDKHGNALVHLTNEGVLFTEATCHDQTLDYFIQRTTGDQEFDYKNINASDLNVSVSNDWTGPMLSIQVTRLKCGSVILTISAFHCLMDSQSATYFMNTWASGGKFLQDYPMIDKTFVLFKSEEQSDRIISRPSNCVFNRDLDPSSESPFIQVHEQRVICKVYYFSVNELKNIKEEATKGLSVGADYISTYDALYAHMIIVIAQATQTSFIQSKKIKILQPFNGRSRFVPFCSPAVLHYFGSLAFWLYGEVPTQEPPTLSSLAQIIHEVYAKQSEYSLRYYNAYLSSGDGNIRNNRVDADISNRDFHCTSWRKMNMLGANFDGSDDGYPIFSGPAKYRGLRYCIMMDANRKDESINVLFGLKEQDYKRMLEQNLLHKYR